MFSKIYTTAQLSKSVVERLLNKEKNMPEKPRRYMHQGSKIFVIGFNKTGTTSVKKAFQNLGYRVGYQGYAEWLTEDHFRREYDRIYDFCNTAQVFQDLPFACPEIYKYLDTAFPNSKFLLTLRTSPEEWFDSMVRFHSIRFGKKGRVPTRLDLFRANKKYLGWTLSTMTNIFGNKLYDKKRYIAVYNAHIHDVKDYFAHKKDNLLMINIAEKGSYKAFCDFLGIEATRDTFPWENKTPY